MGEQRASLGTPMSAGTEELYRSLSDPTDLAQHLERRASSCREIR
jgi:hypothetical protein